MFWSALSVLFLTPSALANIPLGTPMDDSLKLDITPEGFDTIEDLAPSLVPDDIPFPYMYMNDEWEECIYDPFFGWELGCGYVGYELEVDNGWVRIGINGLDIVPANDLLEVDTTIDVQVNEATDPIWIYAGTYVGFSIFGFDVPLPEIGESCYANIDPFPIDVEMQVAMDVGTDAQNLHYLDVSFPSVDWDIGLAQEDLNIWDCFIADLNEVINWLGIDLIGLVLDLIDPLLDDQIQNLLTDLEGPIEEASKALNIRQEVALGESVLELGIYPSEVTIEPAGMRIGLGGGVDADMAECIARYNPQGSLETPSNPPGISESAPGISPPPHFLAFINDDFINQALYGTWYAGLLCQTVVDDGSLPIGINTSLFDLIAPGALTELFPSTEPLIIETRPAAAPVAYADGDHEINVQLDELGLDFYAGIDSRMTRVIGMNMDTYVGVDTTFDGTTGELGIAVALSADDIDASVRFNEYAPEANDAFVDGLLGLVDSIAGSLLGSLLGDLVFPLPAMEGLGVTAIDIAASGPAADYFGAHASAGTVTYGAGGCSCDGSDPSAGCESDAGCDAGCATGTLPARGVMMLIPILIAGFRRRQD
jgi:hypothetical protein